MSKKPNYYEVFYYALAKNEQTFILLFSVDKKYIVVIRNEV